MSEISFAYRCSLNSTMSMNNSSAWLSCNQSLSHFQYQPPSTFDIFTGVLLILITITALGGNILIFYAFITNPKLRVVNNYFIMNLTLSDIITASLVVPFDANMKLHGFSWTHGAVMCKIWTTAYTISVPTSILTLCVVSIDRYQAISNPLGYRAGVTLNKTKALYLIAGVWALSLFMAFLPLIVGSPLNDTLSRDLPPDCPDVYFCYFDISPSYSAAVTIVAFILPSVVMAILYVKMYVIITYERYISDGSRKAGSEPGNIGGKRENKRNKKEHRTGRRKSCNNENGHEMMIIQNGQIKNEIIRNESGDNKSTSSEEAHSEMGRKLSEFCQTSMKTQTAKTGCNEKRNEEVTLNDDCSDCDETKAKNYGNEPKVSEGNGRDGTECKSKKNNQDLNNNDGNKIRSGNSEDSHETKVKDITCNLNHQENEKPNQKGFKRNDCHASTSQQPGQNMHTNVKTRSPERRHQVTSNNALNANSQHGTYQTKVARHFSVIVLVQLVCWYPFSVQSIVYNLCDGCYHISSPVQYLLLTIGYMSCAINPYLYAYQQRSFRQVFNKMLGIKS